VAEPLSVVDVLALLTEGEIEVLGLMPDASNYTFAASVATGERRALAIYKPRDGEAPLWDFPEGTLYAREVAAFVVGEAMGFGFVPPTVARDGPHGIGSVQLFVDAEPAEHYFTMLRERADDFRRVAAYDVVVNNADRKSGHCLLEKGTGRIWFVDHGVCFNTDDKLRTVIWDFAGEPLPDDVVAGLKRLLGSRALDETLRPLLEPDEIDAVRARAAGLLDAGSFPDPPEDRRAYPWPPV
jgi:uncharacterized repeat protein (TIGR03843 family)